MTVTPAVITYILHYNLTEMVSTLRNLTWSRPGVKLLTISIRYQPNNVMAFCFNKRGIAKNQYTEFRETISSDILSSFLSK